MQNGGNNSLNTEKAQYSEHIWAESVYQNSNSIRESDYFIEFPITKKKVVLDARSFREIENAYQIENASNKTEYQVTEQHSTNRQLQYWRKMGFIKRKTNIKCTFWPRSLLMGRPKLKLELSGKLPYKGNFDSDLRGLNLYGGFSFKRV